MHELGVVIEVIRVVEDFAQKNGVTKVHTIVLQIGELSSIIPRYVEACFPAAVDGTSLQETKLKIEILPGNAYCRNCRRVYNLLKNPEACPYCAGQERDILGGKEFMIKEILAC